jgi:recombination protein RecA
MEKPAADRTRALKTALAEIDRQFGKGSIRKLGEAPVDERVDVVSTGSLGVDIALGVGGLPRGRIVEVYGPESSGKTTLALHVIAEAQRLGGTCAFIDAEHALDVSYARRLGVKVDELLLSQPDHGEQALDITEKLVRSSALDVIVIDSVAALVPKAEIEGEMGDSHVGVHARLMSQALRKLTGAIARTDTIVLFINQLRMKIGVMFGSPETTTGGNALKFYASVRLDVRRIERIKEGEQVVANRTRVKVVKNKMAPPFREAEFDLAFGRGVNRLGELIDLGVAANVIEKSGSWFSFKGERLGQGRDAAMRVLGEQPAIAAQVAAGVRTAHGLEAPVTLVPTAPAASKAPAQPQPVPKAATAAAPAPAQPTSAAKPPAAPTPPAAVAKAPPAPAAAPATAKAEAKADPAAKPRAAAA